jgi:hypothetical protein
LFKNKNRKRNREGVKRDKRGAKMKGHWMDDTDGESKVVVVAMKQVIKVKRT